MNSISRYVSVSPISVLNCVSANGVHATHLENVKYMDRTLRQQHRYSLIRNAEQKYVVFIF